MRCYTSKLLIGLLTLSVLVFSSVSISLAEDEVLIGGALSLTGVQAPLDEPGLKGAQVAVKYLNDHGGILGKQVKFVNIDGKSNPWFVLGPVDSGVPVSPHPAVVMVS